MASRMSTRGIKLKTPESLLRHTQEELRKAREAKTAEKEEKKAAAKNEAAKKDAAAKARVAHALDVQALKDANLSSLRPDLEVSQPKQKPKKPIKNIPAVDTQPTHYATVESKSRVPTKSRGSINQVGGFEHEGLVNVQELEDHIEQPPNAHEPEDSARELDSDVSEPDYQELEDDEIEVAEKVKAKKLRNARKKDAKSAVRNGIAELRQLAPPTVNSVTPKRKPETENAK
ncbi:hypothetical protein DFJ43DRAFT_1038928 [Lentinula guzmanii]|uniref:Uncharacterized protein n=1 Tax=Lentinula guzmanii TaxID=2804957 RepID=A0AA38JCX0_9AGAR|nr:hypothetical protein DFJ43DRAFT_1038928 [Lentinula guzmanii]